MNILGITLFTHDSSATLIKGEKIVGCCEEERFSREKHTNNFPVNSINFLLDEGKIKANEIDQIVIPYEPMKNYFSKIYFSIFNNKSISSTLKSLYSNLFLFLNFKKRIKKLFNSFNLNLSDKCEINTFEHHLAHAASSFYVSGFKDAVIITWDGRGEWPCLTVSQVEKNNINKILEQTVPNSLGQFYESVTQYLGFNEFGDEYKVMGLSAYGKPKYYNQIKEIIGLDSKGLIKINPNKWKYNIYKRNSGKGYILKIPKIKKRQVNDKINSKHFDLASSVQKVFNEIGVDFVKNLHKKNNSQNLCLAGGVAQNIVMNQNIYLKSGFKNFFVQPASHDAGISLGAALLAANQKGKIFRKTIFNPCLGASFSNKHIKSVLDTYQIPYSYKKNICYSTAKIISDGYVVGWFQGKTEFGPRALGSRSILADPRVKEMKNIVNKKIKFRESFRPFAPSILIEEFNKFFSHSPKNPYMCFSANVRQEVRKIIPAVTHIDGSARPQAVSKSLYPLFWELIHNFNQITKIPILLNTSFNVKGEPIVNSPNDAIRCFFSSGLDYLVLGNFLIKK